MYIPTTVSGLKTTIPCPNDEWEEEVIIIKRRKRKRKSKPMEPYVVPMVPMDPLSPVAPYEPRPVPWKYTPRRDEWNPTIIWGDHQPCMIDEFFRTNPNGVCMISCPCPRHRIRC